MTLHLCRGARAQLGSWRRDRVSQRLWIGCYRGRVQERHCEHHPVQHRPEGFQGSLGRNHIRRQLPNSVEGARPPSSATALFCSIPQLVLHIAFCPQLLFLKTLYYLLFFTMFRAGWTQRTPIVAPVEFPSPCAGSCLLVFWFPPFSFYFLGWVVWGGWGRPFAVLFGVPCGI